LTICFAAGVALGQQKVTPPPRPPDDGPSLQDTMKFIQDKLNGMGPVNYVAYFHDSVTGKDWINKISKEVSKVDANSTTCTIGFHRKSQSNGTVFRDNDHQFALKESENIIVMTEDQYAKEDDAKLGKPEWSARIDPPTFVLKESKSGTFVDFSDEDLANRVAKAMVHAVELCGGGRKDPF